MESLYTADQIRCAAWYVRSYRQAIEKARQGIKIKIDWACSGLDEAGLRKEFITALFSRIDSKAGHGAGKPTTKQIDETTDLWSFVFYNLGMTFK